MLMDQQDGDNIRKWLHRRKKKDHMSLCYFMNGKINGVEVSKEERMYLEYQMNIGTRDDK
jgi:hypothetical protein